MSVFPSKTGRRLLAGLLPAVAAMLVPAGFASAQSVSQINLIANKASYKAKVTDPIFIDAWGIATAPAGGGMAASPFWISANGWGNTPVYSVTGVAGSPTKIFAPTIPLAKGETGQEFAAPSGQVFNPTLGNKKPGFLVSPGKPAVFLVDTEDGTIAGWTGTGNFVLIKDNYDAGKGAVYKGLTFFTDATGTYLLATNFRSGLVEVYNENWRLVGAFRDHEQPADHAPFNVQTLGGEIYVTYALQDASKHDDTAGPGNGTVEVVDIYGTVLRRADAKHLTELNSAWGVAKAPAGWGGWAGQLVVGNFGNGWINVYNAKTLTYMATVTNKATAKPIVIDGLWALTPGDGGGGGATTELYFSAGPKQETDGLFGVLTFNAPASGGGGW